MSFDLKVTINTSLAQGTLGYLKKMVGEFGSITATKFAGMFAAAAVAKMAFDKVTASMEKNMQMAKQISGLSSKFHIDPKSVHSLLLAANDAGVSVRSLLMGMKQLGNLAGKALVDKNSMGVFKQLGMDVDKVGDIAEKPVKQFAEIAKQLMQIDNETDRAAYGTKMLGRQYQQMLPLIEKLGTSAEARANFLENENAMTKEQVEQQKMVAKMQSEMGEAWDRIVAELAPIILSLTAMVNLIFDSVKWLDKYLHLTRQINAEEKQRQIGIAQNEMDRYKKEREEYQAAKERLTEANSKLTNSSKKLGERTGTGYGEMVGFYGAGKDSKGRDVVGMEADFRTLQRFEGQYATTGTTFVPGSTDAAGNVDYAPQVFDATFSGKNKGKGGSELTETELAIQKAKERLDKIRADADDSWGYKLEKTGQAFGTMGPLGAASVGMGGFGVGMQLAGKAAGWATDDYDQMAQVQLDIIKSLEETGKLEKVALEAEKERLKDIEEERRAKVKYMETFLKVAGMSMTHYIDKSGNILQGQKPQEGFLRPVEDVDAVKKADARKKSARALERKVAREMTEIDGGALGTAEQEVGLTKKEQSEHLTEDYAPKKAAYEAAKAASQQTQAARDAFLEQYGEVMTDDSGKPMLDSKGNAVKGIRKADKRKVKVMGDDGKEQEVDVAAHYAGIAKAAEGAKSTFETAEKDYDKEESKRVDMANAVYKAERALWQALQAEKLQAIQDEDEAQRGMHDRKTKMMELEGKDRREILEENFKFEVAKLEDALTEQEDMERQFLQDGKITADEEKELRKMQGKVDSQANKAEGSMFALAAANKPWQIASDMKAIGGGGKVIGTTGNVAIDQLEVLKENLPASTAYLAKITELLGGGQNSSAEVGTRATPATYAPAKGATPGKPGK